MDIVIHTHHKEVVEAILTEQNLLTPDLWRNPEERPWWLHIRTENDTMVEKWRSWLLAARGCELIYGEKVEVQ